MFHYVDSQFYPKILYGVPRISARYNFVVAFFADNPNSGTPYNNFGIILTVGIMDHQEYFLPMAEIGELENLVPEGFWARFVKTEGFWRKKTKKRESHLNKNKCKRNVNLD